MNTDETKTIIIEMINEIDNEKMLMFILELVSDTFNDYQMQANQQAS